MINEKTKHKEDYIPVKKGNEENYSPLTKVVLSTMGGTAAVGGATALVLNATKKALR